MEFEINNLLIIILLISISIIASIALYFYIHTRKTIKVLKENISAQEELIERFKREAEERNNTDFPSIERIEKLIEKEKTLNTIYRSIPNFIKITDFQERLEKFVKFIDQQLVEKLPSEEEQRYYRDFFNQLRVGADAFKLVILLRDKKMHPLMTHLKGLQVDTLRTSDYNKIIELLFDAVMTTYDVVTTAFNNPNTLPGQELNVKLLENNITREEALSQAKSITDNLYETDLWAIVIKKTLANKGINNTNVIFSGYKLF